VLSEIRKARGSEVVKSFARQLGAENSFVSVISIGEIAKGAALLSDDHRRRSLLLWLVEIESQFSDRILPCDIEIARIWGQLTGRAQSVGQTIAAADGIIAATAIRHGLYVATRNLRHFNQVGAMVVNPWDEDANSQQIGITGID